MPARDRSLPQATVTRKRTHPKLLATGAFLLAVLAAVMPGSDGVALAQTANVALVTSAGNQPIPLNGLYDSGVTLVNAVGKTATVIAISDYKPLKVGLTVEVVDEDGATNSELMTITDLTPGSPATMTVQRPKPVSHAANTHVWANAAPVQILVSNVGERDTGAKLAANVDNNKFENSGATLKELINTTVTSLTVSDLHPLLAGRTVRLDAEQMYVSSLNPGWLQDSGATLANDVGIYQTVIPITDQSKLKVGWIARVDFERMLITGLTDGSPDTMTVERGYGGDSAIEHISGSRIFASGATLEGAVDQTQTEILISDKDLLTVDKIARVDLELMHILTLTEGSPDRMTVSRGYLAAPPPLISTGPPSQPNLTAP